MNHHDTTPPPPARPTDRVMSPDTTSGRRIYLASSWRNEDQPAMVDVLRAAGHQTYDFRNPVEGNHGFSWRTIDPDWKQWSPEQFRTALKHPLSEEGFGFDFGAMKWCDTLVMLQPCGVSAAIELGWAAGAKRDTIVLLAPGREPELMFKVAAHICTSVTEVLEILAKPLHDRT